MEDLKLLRLLQQDPNIGMERLIDCYTGLVYAVVKRRLSVQICVSSDIEDCVADVFSEFYVRLSEYDPRLSSIKSYLCVLARSKASDVLRKRMRRNGIAPNDTARFLEIADAETIDSALSDEELRREVLSLIKGLGEPDTSILMRKYYLGESSREIAEALHMTVSNIDTRTHRALNKLRCLLGGKVL